MKLEMHFLTTFGQSTNYIRCLSDLVQFVQFKKREKHPRRIVTFRNVAGFGLKVTLFHRCFSGFLSCKNRTKSSKALHILY